MSNPSDNTLPVVPKIFKAGDYLVPDIDFDTDKIFSAIRILSVDDKGYKCKRVHYTYNGEEFYMSKEMMSRTHWVLIKEGSQLPLL